MADLLITVMLWFIFDEESTPDIFSHGNYSYPVLNVINEGSFLINNDDSQIED